MRWSLKQAIRNWLGITDPLPAPVTGALFDSIDVGQVEVQLQTKENMQTCMLKGTVLVANGQASVIPITQQQFDAFIANALHNGYFVMPDGSYLSWNAVNHITLGKRSSCMLSWSQYVASQNPASNTPIKCKE